MQNIPEQKQIDKSRDTPWLIHGVSLRSVWTIHALYNDSPWIIRGLSMDDPSHNCSMSFLNALLKLWLAILHVSSSCL